MQDPLASATSRNEEGSIIFVEILDIFWFET
jgi:hypothetical protein